MEKIVVSFILLLSCSSAFASGYGQSKDDASGTHQGQNVTDPSLTIKENAYGLGVGMDQYGRPVTLAPAQQDQGGNYNDSRIQTRDAYGPGIHMDQYGRPVQIVPR